MSAQQLPKHAQGETHGSGICTTLARPNCGDSSGWVGSCGLAVVKMPPSTPTQRSEQCRLCWRQPLGVRMVKYEVLPSRPLTTHSRGRTPSQHPRCRVSCAILCTRIECSTTLAETRGGTRHFTAGSVLPRDRFLCAKRRLPREAVSMPCQGWQCS